MVTAFKGNGQYQSLYRFADAKKGRKRAEENSLFYESQVLIITKWL